MDINTVELTAILRKGWDDKLIFNLDLKEGEVLKGDLEDSDAPYCMNAGWQSIIYRLACGLGYHEQTVTPKEIFELLREAEGFINLLKCFEVSSTLPGYSKLRDRLVDQIAGNENEYDVADAIFETIDQDFKLIPR